MINHGASSVPALDTAEAIAWIRRLHADTGGYVSVSAINPDQHPEPVSLVVDLHDADGVSRTDARLARFLMANDERGAIGLYVRQTSLSRAPVNGRGTIADSLALPGLWIDGDTASPAHKHQPCPGGAACVHERKHRRQVLPLPADAAAVWAIVAEAGLPMPTVTQATGNGVYGYWLLDVPRVVEPTKLGVEARLSERLHRQLQAAARRLGLHYGPLGDLPRVLRLPGTLNRKPGTPGGSASSHLTTDGTGARFTWPEMVGMVEEAEALTIRLDAAARPETAAQPLSRGLGAPGAPLGAPGAPAAVQARERLVQANSPIDDFNARADWLRDVLLPAGWALHSRPGDQTWVTRPGKDPADGHSASINGTGVNTMHVFSSDAAPFEADENYTLAGAWRELHHGGADGDPTWSATNRDLRQRGYGDPLPTVERTPPQPPEHLGDMWAGFDPGTATGSGEGGEGVDAETLREGKVREALERLRIQAEAKELFAAERHARSWVPPTSHGTLSDELAMPEDPQVWRFRGMLGAGHNAILVAGRKTGKTTMINSVVRSYVDGDAFLGKFDVTPTDAGVAIFNYEVDERQYRRWLRDADIINTDRVHVLHLRGKTLPLRDERVRSWVAAWLRDRGIGLWIVDPYSRAYVGSVDNGNDEAQVGAFLDTLDVIKAEAGVDELVMPVHSPKGKRESGEETAIGSQRLEGWPDALWYLTKDDETGGRFLRAEGRDISLPESQLAYHEGSRSVSLNGGGSRAESKTGADVAAVLAYVSGHPGCSGRDITSTLGWGLNRLKKAVESAGKSIEVRPARKGTGYEYRAS